MEYEVRFSSCTDVGQVRSVNQDAEKYFSLDSGEVFVVCDGIGGYAGGDIASKLVVDSIQKYFPLSISLYAPEKALEDTIAHANQDIRQYAMKNPHYRNMGTTVVMLFISKGAAYYAHVGDSRLYYCHKSCLESITKDHSLVQEMVDDGTIDATMARHHPSRNLITRGLGTPNTHPSIGKPIRLSYGDKFLLCTDGLTNSLRDEEIAVLINKCEIEDVSRILVSEANRLGGDDNITVQVVEIR